MNEQQTHVLGVKIDIDKKTQVSEKILTWVNGDKPHHIVTLNPEIALYAYRNPETLKALNTADLTIADGIGLTFATLFLAGKRVQRIQGRELVNEVLKLSVTNQKSVFLLGGAEHVAQKAGESYCKRFPGLHIVGATHGMTTENFHYDNPDLIALINEAQPDILLVAFGGSDKQELWINKNLENLNTCKIIVGIGGLFDYEAKIVKQPPEFIAKLGFEWLYRLITQPKRWKRIFNAVIVFPWNCFTWKIRSLFVYRKNVVGMIVNNKNQVLLVTPSWADDPQWQLPQGGIDGNESPQQSILREMLEEVGLTNLEIISHLRNVHHYKWPRWHRIHRGYRGQKQDFFLLRYLGDGNDMRISREELKDAKWVDITHFIDELAYVRKEMGLIGLREYRRLTSKL